MSVKVTLEFESAAAAALALNLLDGYARGDIAETKPEVEKPEVEKPKAEKPKAEKPKAEKLKAEVPTGPAVVQEDPKQEPAKEEAPAATIEYPVLQKAVFELAGKSRDAAAAVAASFGVKTFKDLDAGKWGEALVAVKAKIAELGE